MLYVNLAGYHVKALRRSLSSRGSGMFVTSLYGGAAFGGYLLGLDRRPRRLAPGRRNSNVAALHSRRGPGSGPALQRNVFVEIR